MSRQKYFSFDNYDVDISLNKNKYVKIVCYLCHEKKKISLLMNEKEIIEFTKLHLFKMTPYEFFHFLRKCFENKNAKIKNFSIILKYKLIFGKKRYSAKTELKFKNEIYNETEFLTNSIKKLNIKNDRIHNKMRTFADEFENNEKIKAFIIFLTLLFCVLIFSLILIK